MGIEELKKKYIDNCPLCKGSMVEEYTPLEQNSKFFIKMKECSCVETFKKYCKYSDANISQEWWEFGINDLEKDFSQNILEDVKFFIKNVEMCVLNKSQFHFHGKNGNGKNLISNIMLKAVVEKRFKGRFFSAFEILDYLYTGESQELMAYDFLVIDEVDKVLSNKIADTCNVIIHLMEYKSLIILSNSTPTDFLTKLRYPQNFIDRIKNIKDVTFPDLNYREKILNKFDTLKKSVNTGN